MIKLTKGQRPDFLKYQDYIYSTGYIYYDSDNYSTLVKHEKVKLNTLESLSRNEMVAYGGHYYNSIAEYDVKKFLKEVFSLSSEDLRSKQAKGESLNTKDVLMPLMEAGIGDKFIRHYIEYKSLKSIIGSLDALPTKWVDAGDFDRHDRPLVRLPYTVSQRTNFRYNYKAMDIVAFPKSFTYRYSVPKGYFLAWGDMKQADLRFAINLMVIDETNYHYFDGASDWYLSVYKLLCDFYNRPADNDDFLSKREDMKACLLSAIYGANSGKSPSQDEIVREFRDYLMTRPKYKEFRSRIDYNIDKNFPLVINTYFDESIHITAPKSSNRIKMETKLRNMALNAPFQAGTSEVVIHVVSYIMDMFYDLGYSEEDVRVYMVRHDEPVFMLSEKAMKDIWVLEDSTSIIVDSWRPMEIEYSYGYNYGVEDEELTEEVNKSIAENIQKCQIHTPSNDFVPFNPIKKIDELILGKWPLPDNKLMVVVIDPEKKKYIPLIDNSVKEDVMGSEVEMGHGVVLMRLLNSSMFDLESRATDLLSVKVAPETFLYDNVLDDGLQISYSPHSDGAIADLLAGVKAYSYCKKHELEFIGSVDDILANATVADRYDLSYEL